MALPILWARSTFHVLASICVLGYATAGASPLLQSVGSRGIRTPTGPSDTRTFAISPSRSQVFQQSTPITSFTFCSVVSFVASFFIIFSVVMRILYSFAVIIDDNLPVTRPSSVSPTIYYPAQIIVYHDCICHELLNTYELFYRQ